MPWVCISSCPHHPTLVSVFSVFYLSFIFFYLSLCFLSVISSSRLIFLLYPLYPITHSSPNVLTQTTLLQRNPSLPNPHHGTFPITALSPSPSPVSHRLCFSHTSAHSLTPSLQPLSSVLQINSEKWSTYRLQGRPPA